MLSCALANADALLVEAAAGDGASWASKMPLLERRQREPAAPITDLQLDRVSLAAEMGKSGIGMVPATWCEGGKRVFGTIGGCKVGPATGQPRTEVPVGPDGSGTVVELGEAFRRSLANAVDCLPSDGQPIDATTIKLSIRNLHAAVAELAKVVERTPAALRLLTIVG